MLSMPACAYTAHGLLKEWWISLFCRVVEAAADMLAAQRIQVWSIWY
jgi:hypothetical protein